MTESFHNHRSNDSDDTDDVNDLKRFLSTMSSGRNIREEIFNMHESHPVIITEMSFSSNEDDGMVYLNGEDFLVEDDE